MANDERIIPPDFEWEKYETTDESHKVKPASEFMDETIRSFGDEAEETAGAPYPWEKADEQGMRFRPGELTIYTGHSESYKSAAQSQVAVHLMRDMLSRAPESSMIASLEMRPKKTLRRMVRQASGTDMPSISYMHDFKEYTNGKLWLYDHLGHVTPRKIIAVCRYAAMELGVKHLFVDSLMMVVEAVDDGSGQKKFVGDFMGILQEFGCHGHLVAHARKPGASGHTSKHDISGASEIEKQADNVLIFTRNEKKTEAAYSNQPYDGPDADVWIKVDKQREHPFKGSFGLGFNMKSMALTNKVDGVWPALSLGN